VICALAYYTFCVIVDCLLLLFRVRVSFSRFGVVEHEWDACFPQAGLSGSRHDPKKSHNVVSLRITQGEQRHEQKKKTAVHLWSQK